MSANHKPETDLPWVTIEQGAIGGLDLRRLKSIAHVSDAPAGGLTQVCAEIMHATDAAYASHAANAYPHLVSLAKAWVANSAPSSAMHKETMRILRDLGESC